MALNSASSFFYPRMPFLSPLCKRKNMHLTISQSLLSCWLIKFTKRSFSHQMVGDFEYRAEIEVPRDAFTMASGLIFELDKDVKLSYTLNLV